MDAVHGLARKARILELQMSSAWAAAGSRIALPGLTGTGGAEGPCTRSPSPLLGGRPRWWNQVQDKDGREGATMTTPTQPDAGPLAVVLDWIAGAPASPRRGTAFPIRVEDYRVDGHYILRAELPGVNPEKDIAVTVSGCSISIKAEKHGGTERRQHAEFHYGTFARTIALPADTDGSRIQAIYGNGILEIDVGLKTGISEQPDHHVPVMVNHHIKPT
jgi:HSP20 family molecular chaperone IbpA